MFKFFKEFDKDIYKEIVDEVEFNMWNNRCISIIQSEIEKIIKIIFKESDIVITNIANDGIVYREYNPSLSRLFSEQEFKQYLAGNNILNFSDIDDYWKILNARNDKEHGEKANKEKTKITLQMKKDTLKYLFKLCYNSYVYKFKKIPKTYWDDEYFKKLLVKPEEKVIEVEKVVEKIVEKEGKSIENTELQKIKIEHENLKSQFEIIKNTATSFSNIELLKKLDIAYSCLKNKDFDNAKIALNNCRNIDISNYETYVGFILCDYKVSSLEELVELFISKNTLATNENYNNILKFCSENDIEKLKNLMDSIDEHIEDLRYKIPYNYAITLFECKNYQEAFCEFQKIYEYKDSLNVSNTILSKLLTKYKKLSKSEDRFDRYKKLLNVSKEEKTIKKLNELIEDEIDFHITNEKGNRFCNSKWVPKHKSKIILEEGITTISIDHSIKINDNWDEMTYFIESPNEIIFPNSLENIEIKDLNCTHLIDEDRDNLKLNYLNDYGYWGNKENPYLVLMKAQNFNEKNIAETTKFVYSDSITIKDKELTIPKNIKLICPRAISSNTLEKIIINHEVSLKRLIDDRLVESFDAFHCCTKLKYLEFNNIKYLGEYKSYDFNQLLDLIDLDEDMLYDDTFCGRDKDYCDKMCKLACVNTSANKEINLKFNNINTIGHFAFAGSYNMNNAIFHNVTNIGHFAFAYCVDQDGIAKINLRDVKSIGKYAFLCSWISEVVLSMQLNIIDEGVFLDSQLQKINLENIKRINKYAFSGCDNLRVVGNLQNVEYIGDGAFAGTSLAGKIILSKIKEIGDYAFSGCNISEIYLPATIKHLGESCFEDCENIKIVIWGSKSDFEKNNFLKEWIVGEYNDNVILNLQ